MDIKPIHCEVDYLSALKEIDVLMPGAKHKAPGTPDGDRFDILSHLLKTTK